jgi:hypothetical protein
MKKAHCDINEVSRARDVFPEEAREITIQGLRMMAASKAYVFTMKARVAKTHDIDKIRPLATSSGSFSRGALRICAELFRRTCTHRVDVDPSMSPSPADGYHSYLNAQHGSMASPRKLSATGPALPATPALTEP